MFGMSNDDLYIKMNDRLSMHETFINSDLRNTNRIVNKLNQDINKHEENRREWLSDIANRLEATLANEKENQALKEHIEKLEERIEELEQENEWLEMCLKISRASTDALIHEFMIKGD